MLKNTKTRLKYVFRCHKLPALWIGTKKQSQVWIANRNSHHDNFEFDKNKTENCFIFIHQITFLWSLLNTVSLVLRRCANFLRWSRSNTIDIKWLRKTHQSLHIYRNGTLVKNGKTIHRSIERLIRFKNRSSHFKQKQVQQYSSRGWVWQLL